MSAPASHGAGAPSAWVQRFAPLVAAGGQVLDLACGRGRHSRLLAMQGCVVTAVDRDPA
ncbi:MAG: methyltransferase domain-containing protein, partial [Rhodocyclaceae bacterium]|nr:methyltransferase domain-containing protein [Rhodocyclaceae bacterium]